MLEPGDINERIKYFKGELNALAPVDIVRKHIINGGSAILEDGAYFDLRAVVAEKYAVHTNDVLVVGSSKLGFSIAPRKRYRHFADTSDVDVVIVSAELFHRIWKAVHSFWEHGGYWERDWEFKNYLFQGWIRPDKLPPARSFELANNWWQFFNKLSSGGKYSMYKIRGALYLDWYFLEAYQLRAVTACVEELRVLGEKDED